MTLSPAPRSPVAHSNRRVGRANDTVGFGPMLRPEGLRGDVPTRQVGPGGRWGLRQPPGGRWGRRRRPVGCEPARAAGPHAHVHARRSPPAAWARALRGALRAPRTQRAAARRTEAGRSSRAERRAWRGIALRLGHHPSYACARHVHVHVGAALRLGTIHRTQRMSCACACGSGRLRFGIMHAVLLR